MDIKNFSANLSYLRKSHNLTTGQLAQAIKVAEDKMVGWELGMEQPESKDILKISKFFTIDIADLCNTILGEKTETKTKEVPSTNAQVSKKSLAMQIVLMILSMFTLITFAFKCFEVSIATPLFDANVAIIFFDFMFPEKFTIDVVFCWIIFLTLVYNIVNTIILLSSKKIRNGGYYKTSQILLMSLNGLSLALWIATCILNKGLSFKFPAIWLFVAAGLIVYCLIIANAKLSAKNLIVYTLYFVCAAIMAYIVFYLFTKDFVVNFYLDEYYDGPEIKYYRMSKTYMVFILIPLILAIVPAVLLMFKKFKDNYKARIGLGITGIITSICFAVLSCFLYFYTRNKLLREDYCERIIAPDGIFLFIILSIITGVLLTIAFCFELNKKEE